MISRRFSLLFFLRKPKNFNSVANIYMRITIDEERAELSTKRVCDPKRWNSKAGRMNGTKEDAKTINVYLDTLQSKVYNVHTRLIEADEEVTADVVKNELAGTSKRERFIMKLFQQHNEQMRLLVAKEDYAEGTLSHFETAYTHVLGFLKWKYNRSDIDVRKINYDFISDLEFYLKTEKDCNHNTVMKYLGDFKKIVLLAVKKQWLLQDHFLGYQLTRKDVVKEFLVEEELNAISAKQFAAERLTAVRDIFLFSCYTGLAYADVQKLKRSEIRTGIDEFKWLFIQRKKSHTPATIPLLPVCLDIIDRYRSNARCIEKDMVLPVLSNQKMNEYLKEIATVCGIEKVLTYHLARYTFATTVTLNNDVPIESVSKMLGHKNLKTTQHYAKILNKKVSEDMKILRRKLETLVENKQLKAI
jgi:site-specific recombinase XerD